MRNLLFLVLILALPATALTPEETVKKVYQTHFESKSFRETIRQCESCFTPGFLGVMERALSKKPGSTRAYVDFDFFVNSQAGFPRFEVGRGVVQFRILL